MRSGIERIFAGEMDLRNIPWEYEKQTFQLQDRRYTPDFFIGNRIVEMKGRASESDVERAYQFLELHGDDWKYFVCGDTKIETIPADRHYHFDTQREDLLDRLQKYVEWNRG